MESTEQLYSPEKELLEIVSDQLPIGILIFDSSGKTTYQNKHLKTLFGYDPEEIPNKEKFLEMAHPDPAYRNQVDRAWKEDFSDPIPGSGKPRLFSVTGKDGTRKNIRFRFVRLKTGGFLVTGEDLLEKELNNRIEEEQSLSLQTLIDAVPSPIFYKDRAGKYLGCNQAFEQFFNIRRTDLIGRTVSDIRPPAESEMHTAEDRTLLEHQGILEYEVQPVLPGGERRSVINRKAPFYKVDGTIGGIVGVFLDITERRKAEERLRESEHKFRKLTEKSSVGIYLIQKGIFRYLNARYAEIFGYPVEDLISRNALKELIYPEDRPLMEEIIRKRKTDQIPFYQYQIRGITKDGRIIYLDVYSSRTFYQGSPATIGSVIDITDRKESEKALKKAEEKYRAIFENSMVGIFQSTPEGRYISVNPALASIHGYSTPLEMMEWVTDIGQQLYVNPEDRIRYMQLLERKELIKNFEAQLYRKDRSKVWISMNVRTQRDPQGHVLFYEGIVEDITEKRSLEIRLAQAQKMEAIGTLAGGIAHDFNNLLMGVQGYASLILFEMKSLDPNYDRILKIEKLAQSGAELTKQILGFAKGGVFNPKSLDLNEILRETAIMFGRTKKEITLHLNCQERLSLVTADRGQVEQVLLNLFVNAWQAMPEGGQLYLETKHCFLDQGYLKPYNLNAGEYIQVSVTDTGVGMDRKTKARIFEPFFSTKEVGLGTGLGLSMVYRIMKNHQGFINVYSEEGIGSTFNLYFPVFKGTIEKEAQAPASIRTGVETILVIDDEEMVLLVTREMLRLLGYQVFTAQSGKEALAFYRTHWSEIVLVILDMIMPDMGGRETLELLKAINPEVRVILSSGYSLNGQVMTLLQQGCNAFLQKPFSMDTLSVKIREVIDSEIRIP